MDSLGDYTHTERAVAVTSNLFTQITYDDTSSTHRHSSLWSMSGASKAVSNLSASNYAVIKLVN